MRGSEGIRRLAAELVVIVIGVLLALAIDAWWSDRQERVAEREAIKLLRSEFESNAARLDTVAGQHRESLDAGYDLLQRMDDEAGGRAASLPANLLYEFVEVWTYDPINGGLNSLIASGQLGILEDERLRTSLSGWPDIVADLRENEEEQWNNTFAVLTPFLMEIGVWEDVLRSRGQLRRLQTPERPADLSFLLRSQTLRRHVVARINNLHNLLDEVGTVDAEIVSILELLDDAGHRAGGA